MTKQFARLLVGALDPAEFENLMAEGAGYLVAGGGLKESAVSAMNRYLRSEAGRAFVSRKQEELRRSIECELGGALAEALGERIALELHDGWPP